MKIVKFEELPIHEILYKFSASSKKLEYGVYKIFIAHSDFLPENVEAIFVTSDIQGFQNETIENRKRLLGEVISDELVFLSNKNIIPEKNKIGIILAGDLFSDTIEYRRGVSGNVSNIWEGFANQFKWVAGVAGNHDTFDENPKELFSLNNKIHFLDCNYTDVCGFRIAGITGIIGNPRRPFRKKEEDFIKELNQLINNKPDILILHEGPNYPQKSFRGNDNIRKTLETRKNLLVVFGHCYWKEPLIMLNESVQLLNVDSRGFLLMR